MPFHFYGSPSQQYVSGNLTEREQTVRGAEVVCQYAVHHYQKSPDLDIVRRIICGGEDRSATESKQNESSLCSVTDA